MADDQRDLVSEKTLFWRTVTSTTFLFNIITFIIAAAALPEVADLIPQSWAKAMLVVNPLGNLIIRQFLTATPITRMAAQRARVKAGMPANKKVGNRWNDPVALPEELREHDAKQQRQRRSSDHEEVPIGRSITNTAHVKSTKKKRARRPAPKKATPQPEPRIIVRKAPTRIRAFAVEGAEE